MVNVELAAVYMYKLLHFYLLTILIGRTLNPARFFMGHQVHYLTFVYNNAIYAAFLSLADKRYSFLSLGALLKV